MKVLILTLALASLARADEPAAPDLSGRWVLDAEKSEDGRQKMRDAAPMRGPRGGGSPRGGPGGSPGGGARGGRPPGGRGGGGLDDFRELLRSLTEAPPAVAITQTPTEITIVEEEGRFRALHPDRKEYKGTGGQKVQTRWEGGRLVVETKASAGQRLVETFELGPEGLVAVVRLEGGRGDPPSVRRVYRKAPAE